MGLDATFDRIKLDIGRARDRHGPLSRDPVRACAIMMREAGEAMNEALLLTSPRENIAQPTGRRKLLYAELSQVAATCAIIMTNMEEEGL